MSVVYLAMNERANKQWAIKEVRKDGVKDYDVVRQGLIAETDILKRLNHPHLPSIIDVIDRDDTFLIVMDYIEGKSLDHWLKKDGAQPQEKVVEWAKQICDVLGYLHSRKPPIIYRDLKPANVMLKPDGQIMIIDFGTAREFKETSIEDTSCLGTQGYAAPEQYGGHGQTDARTDIYTLGATMYHLLTGHNPSLPPYEMYPIRRWNPALSSGLEKIGDDCYQSTLNSGEFDGIGVEISADGGSISSGELEMSNVDLSSQFTDMIVTQRGFQANSRVITTSDTLLEELINLKR